MPRRGSSKPPAEPVVKPYGCDFAPKQLIMIGFIAYVKKSQFTKSVEVDDMKWCKMDEVDRMIARENNCSGMHWDKCRDLL